MKNPSNHLRQASQNLSQTSEALAAKLYWLINFIPPDKQLHFLWAYIVADLGANVWNIETGLSIATGLVILKEIFDKYTRKGNPDMVDMVYGMLGVVLRWIMWYVFD